MHARSEQAADGAVLRVALDASSAVLDRLATRVVFFRLGNLVFVTFGLFVAMGAGVSVAGAGAILIGQGLTGDLFLVLAVGASVAVVGGSWLAGLLLDCRLVLRQGWPALRRPIFVSWGGLLAMPVALASFAALADFNLLVLLDALARAVPLGLALGRLGCLSYGCCFGRPTASRLAITYRNPQAKAVRVAGLRNIPLHPAALYEAILALGIFAATNCAVILNAALGVPTGLALFLYGVGRFGIEFLRDNDERLVIGRLSVNHLLCFVVAGAGGLSLPVLLCNPERVPTYSWTAGLDAVPFLVLAIVPSAALMFLGFALHWRRVGHW